jgi:hypothetical protein
MSENIESMCFLSDLVVSGVLRKGHLRFERVIVLPSSVFSSSEKNVREF